MSNSNKPDLSFTKFGITLVFCTFLLSLAITYKEHMVYPMSTSPKVDAGIRKNFLNDINKFHPDIVLLGDSMLENGVDVTIASTITGKKIEKISIPGSASALWYLILKNNIVKASTKPDYLAIFFRDSLLTIPEYRVNGEYFFKIDEYASDTDMILIQKAFITPRSTIENMSLRYIPLFSERVKIQNWINTRFQSLLPGIFESCDSNCVENAKGTVFSFSRLKPDVYGKNVTAFESTLYTPDRMFFETQVSKSFLPDIIDLCKGANIKLVLVRMGTTRYSSKSEEPILLKYYLSSLENYVKVAGVVYIDTAYRYGITKDQYMDSVHLNPEGKKMFSEEFAKELLLWMNNEIN
jgi:hypothetical protein